MTTPTTARVSGTIRQLEWRTHNDKYDGGRTHYGTGAFGHWYAISRARSREWLAVHHIGSHPHHLPPAASIDAAKAAAQADYNARILAAIQPDPEPVATRSSLELVATPSSAGTVSVEVAGWQPIETAPIGVPFLASDGEDMYKAELGSDGLISAWCGQPVVYDVTPTHWMPLPEPPALRALAGEGGR